MTPPEVPVHGQDGLRTERPPAVSLCLTLTRRGDFLRAAQAQRQGMPACLLQARQRRPGEAAGQLPAEAIRIGYTCSRKIGNAVIRNRAKRRLREIARMVVPLHGQPGWDYVLVGRPGATVARDFAAMKAELARALGRLHAAAP